jgi:hypothetical protein
VIGAGLPGSAKDWPAGVLDRLRAFRQGDVVARPPLAYLADPRVPVWVASRRLADELRRSGEPLEPEVVYFPMSVAPPYGMVITQTCDIVEEDTETPVWPWVQLVPVYDMDGDLNSGDKRMLRGGQGWRRLLHVPGLLPGFHVADFRISFPVEKGWLAAQTPIDGFGSEESRQRVGERLAYLSGRPAFGGSFVAAVQKPLSDALRALRRDDSSLFAEMHNLVPEVGVRLDSRLSPTTAQVVVVCTAPLGPQLRAWWTAWWDACRDRAAVVGIELQALDFRVLDETYSAAEYRSLTLLPLVAVSAD